MTAQHVADAFADPCREARRVHQATHGQTAAKQQQRAPLYACATVLPTQRHLTRLSVHGQEEQQQSAYHRRHLFGQEFVKLFHNTRIRTVQHTQDARRYPDDHGQSEAEQGVLLRPRPAAQLLGVTLNELMGTVDMLHVGRKHLPQNHVGHDKIRYHGHEAPYHPVEERH